MENTDLPLQHVPPTPLSCFLRLIYWNNSLHVSFYVSPELSVFVLIYFYVSAIEGRKIPTGLLLLSNTKVVLEEKL